MQTMKVLDVEAQCQWCSDARPQK